MIEIENLTKRFSRPDGDAIVAVDKLNLSIEGPQIFGFLGPNGVGKTTTIRMLACLLAPSSGTARVNGFDVGRNAQAVRQSIGLLSENPGFYDGLSAERNLAFFAQLYGVKHPLDQARQYLKWLDLWNRRSDLVGTFSKGMRQKLGLARAAMHSPQVLFLDEPTSGLDPDVAKQMRDFMVSLKNDGRTVFLCTHNLDEADRLCDHIGVFKHRLIVMDTPANLRHRLFGKEVSFSLGHPAEDWAPLVRQQPFVSHVESSQNELIVRLENPEEQNPVIICQLVTAGAEIQYVREAHHTLEEVYLRILGDSSKGRRI